MIQEVVKVVVVAGVVPVPSGACHQGQGQRSLDGVGSPTGLTAPSEVADPEN